MNNILAQAILSSWLSGAGNTPTASGMKFKKPNYSMATCPDPQCRTVLYFPTHEPSVECSGCGQRHPVSTLSDRRELSDKEEEFQRSITEMKSLYGGKKTAELVKVKGISNYQCKLLSPFLTTHGKDRNDQPRLLKDLGLGDVFDCSKLGSRAFAIESSLLDAVGYGQDKSGSVKYLQDTLRYLKEANNNVQCLVPIHADGDGHCLVHAISRCLVGRELFWHALRTNMQAHLKTHSDKYAEMLKDFYEKEEWPEIINEAGPDYHPPEGQSLGLRTVHIFALANVLRRPIILLDSIAGMQSKGDYSGIFLPSLHTPDECKTQGVLNSPIIIAWSNAGYNHFIPLVPIKDKPLPKLPSHLRPKVWGVDESLLTQYIHIEEDDSIILAKGKPLQDTYLQKLVTCMEKLFYNHYGVVTSLVADVNQHVYRSAGCVGVSLDTVIMETKSATEENRLFRCLLCSGITNVPQDWVCRGGTLYTIAANEYSLQNGQKYSFPRFGITAEYNSAKDVMVPVDVNCFHCSQVSRRLKGDGTILYENGDRTQTRADPKYSKCCGFKHYWNGKEYDNLPETMRFNLNWKGRQKLVEIHWFQNEKDPSLNSNMYEVAYQTVSKYFPGEFGSEQLVQQVVDMIISATESKTTEQTEHNDHLMETDQLSEASHDVTKTIITGMNKSTKILHKEELGVSETERGIKRKVEQKMQKLQQNITTGNKSSEEERSTRKTSPSPRDSLVPPTKISPTDSNTTVIPTGSKPSPPSPSSVPAGYKKIRITSSEGKNAHLVLAPNNTFIDLQLMIENELGIPPEEQKLRWGFPPKELCPSGDPDSPLVLSHGERVSVERIGLATPVRTTPNTAGLAAQTAKKGNRSAAEGITDHFRSLFKEMNTFSELQKFPHLFRKGGHCYEELVRCYGNQLKDGLHVQFAEMSDVVFRYNGKEECLEVCLGLEHVPVGPLTQKQKELAVLAAQNNDEKEKKSGETHSTAGHVLASGRSNDPHVKAFSGAGRTLGGGDIVPSSGRGIEGGDIASSADRATQLIEELSSYNQTLLQTAQLIVNTRLSDLRLKEKQLQSEVLSLNNKLSEGSSSEQNESSDDKELQRKLLEMSSELKDVRNEIRELSNL